MTVDETTQTQAEQQQQQMLDLVPRDDAPTTEETTTTTTEPRKKTRRSRRGGYRRKRQQQKKVAALMAESAARREEEASKLAKDDSSTATATTEGESSSCESTNGNSSPQRVARKRNNPRRQQKQQQTTYYEPYMHPMTAAAHIAAQQQYHYNNAMTFPQQSASPKRQQKGAKNNQRMQLTEEQKLIYVALDCEMVGVGEYGANSVLARVTLIDWYGNTLMDELVKPEWEVTDYRTFVSGITKEMLDDAKMDFATCRQQVLKHLQGKILVGHGLKNDLRVLGITHPWYMIRDTAKYEPYMKVRFQDGVLWPRGLKDLSKELLNRDVQVYGRPHCPKEDALAALDLYRLVWPQFEKSMEYKWNRTMTMQQQHHQQHRQHPAVVVGAM